MRGALALLGLVLFAGCGGGAAERGAAAQCGWEQRADGALARTEVAAARVGTHVYVAGGFEERSGVATAAVERYDIARDRWSRVADMPFALHHAAAVSHRGRVYVIGGYRHGRGLTRETAALLRYDPGSDRWTRLPSMPTARGALAAAVVRGRIYAVGGANAGGNALRHARGLRLRRGRWSRARPMRLAREHLAAAVAGGRFYALAGRATGAGNFDAVEAYDPRARRWRPAPAMAKARGRHRGRDRRGPDRRGRRRGGGGHDRRGRALRPAAAPLAAAAGPADAAPRARRRRPRRRAVRAPGRRRTGLRVHADARGPGRGLLLSHGEAALRRVAARSQPPSGRRTMSPRAISRPSAVVTDGRRAPTMPASVRWGGAGRSGRRPARHGPSAPPGTRAARAGGRRPASGPIACIMTSARRAGGALDERGEDLRPLRGAYRQRVVDDVDAAFDTLQRTLRGSSTSASRSPHTQFARPASSADR